MEVFDCLYCPTRIEVDLDPRNGKSSWFQLCPNCGTRYLLETEGGRVKVYDLEEVVIA